MIEVDWRKFRYFDFAIMQPSVMIFEWPCNGISSITVSQRWIRTRIQLKRGPHDFYFYFFSCFCRYGVTNIKRLSKHTFDGKFSAVAERLDCCAAGRGFDSRTEQIFVWSTSNCFRSGRLCMWVYMFVNAPTTQEKFLVWGNVSKKNLSCENNSHCPYPL